MAGATLLDVFNEGAGLTNDIVNTLNSRLEQQAQYDLNNMRIQLESDTNQKLLELQQSDNYEDWGKEADDFLTKVNSQMSDKNSPYYCRNQYTAKQAQLMLDSNRANLQNQVAVMQLNKINEQNVVNYQNKKAQMKQYESGQKYIDDINSLATNLKHMGILSPEKYDEEIKNNFVDGYNTYYLNRLNHSYMQGIADGKSLDEIYDEVVTQDPQSLKLYGADGFEIKMDMQTLSDNLKKVAEQTYNAKLTEYQNGNENTVSNNYSDICSDIVSLATGKSSNWESTLAKLRTGSNHVDTLGGNKLASGRQTYWADKYRNLLSSFDDMMKAGSSGNGSGSSTKLNLLSMKDILNPDQLYNFVQNGDISPLTASKLYQSMVQDLFINGDVKENYVGNQKMDENTRRAIYENKYASEGVIEFLDSNKVMKTLEQNMPDLTGTYNDIVKAIKDDVNNDDYEFAADALQYVGKWIYKVAINTDGNSNQDELKTELKKIANACVLNGMKKAFPTWDTGDFKGSKAVLSDDYQFVNDPNMFNNDYFAKTTAELETSDYVLKPGYGERVKDENGNFRTDKNGNYVMQSKDLIYTPGTEQKIKSVAGNQAAVMQLLTGTDQSEYHISHETKAMAGGSDKNDASSVLILTDNKGNSYKFESVEGGLDKYHIMKEETEIDADGNEQRVWKEAYTVQDIYNALYRDKQKATDEKQKSANEYADASKGTQAQVDKTNKERQSRIAAVKDAPELIVELAESNLMDRSSLKKKWKAVDSESTVAKEKALQKTVDAINSAALSAKKNDKAKKNFEKKYGISYEVWNSKKLAEKEDYVLNYKSK